MSETNIQMFFDGASKSNPGPSGSACWIIDGQRSYGEYKFIGVKTNNEAEYNGLILGLKSLLCYSNQKIKVYGDSKLVIEQMKGNWKVKADNLKPLWKEAQELTKKFNDIEFIHVRRELNSKADALANIAVQNKSSNSNVEI
jgi:ribonuclease HI